MSVTNQAVLIGLTCGTFPQGPDGDVLHAALCLDYIYAVERAEAVPILVPTVTNPNRLLKWLSGLILTGGEDVDPVNYGQERIRSRIRNQMLEPNPLRDEYELSIARGALELDLPVLGICRGMQLLNVLFGGSLRQDISGETSVHFKPLEKQIDNTLHPVQVKAGSLLADALGNPSEFLAVSGHHQAVERLGRTLLAVAHAPDGIVEGIESAEHSWVIGVQWHPEASYSANVTYHKALFDALVAAARRFRLGHLQKKGKT